MKVMKVLRGNYLRMDGVKYRPYTVGNLPSKFAYLFDEIKDNEGTREWFNHKGLTYIKDEKYGR